MKNSEQIDAKLRAHEQQLKEAGILRLSFFGSTARGEAGPDSDINLLAKIDDRRLSLLDVVGLQIQLAELLGRQVDLSEEGRLKPRIRDRVEAEAVPAF